METRRTEKMDLRLPVKWRVGKIRTLKDYLQKFLMIDGIRLPVASFWISGWECSLRILDGPRNQTSDTGERWHYIINARPGNRRQVTGNTFSVWSHTPCRISFWKVFVSSGDVCDRSREDSSIAVFPSAALSSFAPLPGLPYVHRIPVPGHR